MEYSGNNKKRQIIAALAVLIVVVVIVAAATAANKKRPIAAAVTATPKATTAQTVSPTMATPANISTPSETAATNMSGYADGSYTATGSYESPGGQEDITITVALKNGVITSTSAKSGAGDPTALEYQNDFIGGYKSQVVGKSITSLNLSRVSGSSLTSQGFNDAIQNIKNQAKV